MAASLAVILTVPRNKPRDTFAHRCHWRVSDLGRQSAHVRERIRNVSGLLRDQLPIFWAKQKGDLALQINYDPLLGVVESHGTIQAIDSALADAPRVKRQLEEQLRVAKQTLGDLSKK